MPEGPSVNSGPLFLPFSCTIGRRVPSGNNKPCRVSNLNSRTQRRLRQIRPAMAIGHTLPAGDAAHRAPATLIASVQRALRLLEATSAAPNGAPAKQLARKVSLPLSTTYHLLRTLTFEGYLRRLPDGTYIMGDEIGRLLEPANLQGVI